MLETDQWMKVHEVQRINMVEIRVAMKRMSGKLGGPDEIPV